LGQRPLFRALFPIQANAALIPARGNVAQGAAYKFVDWSIEKGGTCFYKLEDIDLSGNATIHVPVSASAKHISLMR